MKLVEFNLGNSEITGIVASRKDKWGKLIPKGLHGCLAQLNNKLDGDLTNSHGFFLGSRPLYAIVVFEEYDILETIAHEAGHVQRHIVWQMDDQIVEGGDEGYSDNFTYIYETFKEKLRKQYGLKTKVWFDPNKKQRKNEIT
jgi:hypothetical protein